MILGLIISAIGNGPALIQSMPELMVYGKECNSEGSVSQVEDMVSGLFISALSSGEFFGPLLVTTFT